MPAYGKLLFLSISSNGKIILTSDEGFLSKLVRIVMIDLHETPTGTAFMFIFSSQT